MKTTTMRDASLESIKGPVATELKTFQGRFREAMRSSVGLVDLVARYLLRQKGKRVRPILVFLSAKACGGVTERSYRGATLVEILHTATLVHDDVVDDAETRRGLASINAVWKNKVAVLMGDYLLARGLLLSLEHGDHDFLESTSRAVRRMSEGELLQIQKTRHLDLDEETYFKIIGDKTASLLSTCTEIGAASATEDAGMRTRMREFGELLGMAFQIRDDLLDYLGRRTLLGKPTGLDVKEKKLTLPLIHALRQAPRKDARKALSIVKNGADARELSWLIEFVEREGGIQYATDAAGRFAHEAHEKLSILPDSPSRTALQEFVTFVVTRDR